MAKTKGPLLSLDAHGSLNKILTYSNRKSGQQVRKYNKPLAVPSAKQRGQRRLTEFLVAQWQNMSSGQRATWEVNAKASGKNLPGYQYFLREAQRDLYTHHGLVGYWHCNEYVDGKILDLSGNGIHGTPKPSYPSNVPTLVNSKNSKFSKALKFDGIDEYITTSVLSKLQVTLTSLMTYMFWVKYTAAPGGINEPNLLQHQIQGMRIRFFNDGKIVIKNPPIFTNKFSAIVVPLNTYNLIAVTYNGNSTGKIIVANANTFSVNPFIDWPVATSSGYLYFGGLGASTYYGGYLDEITYYNRILSDDEIKTRIKFANQKPI